MADRTNGFGATYQDKPEVARHGSEAANNVAQTDAENPSDRHKIFIGGLAQDATRETLMAHFATFGKITDAVVMFDGQLGRSRGFGFVSFDTAESVDDVLGKTHVIRNKEVECKRATPRVPGAQRAKPARNPGPAVGRLGKNSTDKIFVGGLPDLTSAEFREYFESFGEVTDAVLMLDKETQRPRGFGFVTFANVSSVDAVMRKYDSHTLKGKWVECKLAYPRVALNTPPAAPIMQQRRDTFGPPPYYANEYESPYYYGGMPQFNGAAPLGAFGSPANRPVAPPMHYRERAMPTSAGHAVSPHYASPQVMGGQATGYEDYGSTAGMGGMYVDSRAVSYYDEMASAAAAGGYHQMSSTGRPQMAGGVQQHYGYSMHDAGAVSASSPTYSASGWNAATSRRYPGEASAIAATNVSGVGMGSFGPARTDASRVSQPKSIRAAPY